MPGQNTWLCPDPADRERLLEIDARFGRPRILIWATLGLGLLATVPWIGVLPLLLFLPAALALAGLTRLAKTSSRPENALAAAMLVAQLASGAAIAVTGGPESPVMPILINSVAGLGVRFRPRVAAVGAGVTIAILLAATAGVDPAGFARFPVPVVCLSFVIVAVALFSSLVMRSELEQRTASSLDALTGLLNRKALRKRFSEVRQLATARGDSVSVVVADIDHFKAVNDEHGHYTGDEVLVDVAETLRSTLRSFELLYRVGGEEFVAVFPGTDAETAHVLAERLRGAIEASRPGGLDVTISAGISTATGAAIDYTAMFQEADRALYRAKRAGRNGVVAAGGAPIPIPVAA